ncbi:MAG TPA: hypothetical protein VGK58_21300 [Lacipirellulaceae bacterium]
MFRYPCGPNRVFYGHKATCWREWPTSGSHWRDVHCGPPMSPEVMPHEAELFGVPGAGPVPAEGDETNPFRGEAGEAPPLPEMQSPSFTEPGAQEPNSLPPAPENAGGAQPEIPQGQDAAPDQPMPDAPMSGDESQPMANLDQPEAAFTKLDRAPAQPQNSTVDENRALPAIVAAPRYVVEDALPPGAATSSAPMTESGSRWRLVVHDNPDGVATDNRVNASLFRPPSFSGTLTETAPAQKSAPQKRSLEEETGHALQRFISFETPPSANR